MFKNAITLLRIRIMQNPIEFLKEAQMHDGINKHLKYDNIDCYTSDLMQSYANYYHQEKLKPVPSTTQLYISAEYLQGLHPELSIEEAESLNQFARGKTMELRECYGDGSIMYPMWEANH